MVLLGTSGHLVTRSVGLFPIVVTCSSGLSRFLKWSLQPALYLRTDPIARDFDTEIETFAGTNGRGAVGEDCFRRERRIRPHQCPDYDRERWILHVDRGLSGAEAMAHDSFAHSDRSTDTAHSSGPLLLEEWLNLHRPEGGRVMPGQCAAQEYAVAFSHPHLVAVNVAQPPSAAAPGHGYSRTILS